MISAHEANQEVKSNTNERISFILTTIEQSIRLAVDKKQYQIQYDSKLTFGEREFITKELERFGYTVVHNQGGDIRSNWNYISISWRT